MIIERGPGANSDWQWFRVFDGTNYCLICGRDSKNYCYMTPIGEKQHPNNVMVDIIYPVPVGWQEKLMKDPMAFISFLVLAGPCESYPVS